MTNKKVLVFSYNTFSDENANGKTLKELLSGFSREELAQFYCGEENPDFAFCQSYFHVTDIDMIKSFIGKRKSRIINLNSIKIPSEKVENKIKKANRVVSFLKKHHYNFFLRGWRERLWSIAPWGKKELFAWIETFKPTCILYMVGENWSIDKLIIKISTRYSIPVVLYNAEAYRLVDPKSRSFFAKCYYKKVNSYYEKLLKVSVCSLYNSKYLKNAYEYKYKNSPKGTVVYNTSIFETSKYQPLNDKINIVYFGNLGVGRVESLCEIADCLKEIGADIELNVYGKAQDEKIRLMKKYSNLNYCGFVGMEEICKIKQNADILVHVESFDPIIMPRLKYAFSTKIAQYLCAGRCILSYAPIDMASTQYFIETDSAIVVNEKQKLYELLNRLIQDTCLRTEYSEKALSTALRYHDRSVVSHEVRNYILEAINEI